jgi:hypothetical protein
MGDATVEEGDAAIAEDDAAVANDAALDGGPSDRAESDGESVDATPRSDYRSIVLSDAPKAYYRFDDPVGAPFAADEVGAHPGPVVTPVTFGVPGAVGTAAHFGSGGHIDLGDIFDFDGLVPYTFEAWVRPESFSGTQELIKKRDGYPLKGYVMYLNSTDLHHEFWGNSLSAWTESPLPEGFVHVVITASYVDGKGNAAIYVNGARAPKGGWDNTTPAPNTTYPLLIGSGFSGTIDELAIYDTALSSTRIAVHAQAGPR